MFRSLRSPSDRALRPGDRVVRIGLALFLAFAALAAQAASADGELIANGDFADGGRHWNVSTEGEVEFEHRFESAADGAGQWLVIETDPGAKIGFSRASQALAEVPDEPVKLTFRVASENVEGGNGAYAYLEFLDGAGRRISGLQSDFAPKNGEVAEISIAGEVPAETRRAVLRMMLHGRGEARFTDVRLARMDAEARGFAPMARLTVGDEPAGAPFYGIGAEDDGWAYTRGNAAKGWSEADTALREKRLRWLRPSFVRSFIWTHDWLPSGFWRGEEVDYLFDGDQFQSKLRTWSLYEEIGTEVKLAQVGWRQGGLWDNADRHIPAIGDLFAYLHEEHGLTNIRSYAVANEPNHSMYKAGGDFDLYIDYHEGLAEVFGERGLEVGLAGSDDGNGAEWFRRCVETPAIRDNVAYFASHKYIPYPTLNPTMVDGFFEDRMATLRSNGVKKPFLVTEFGFTGSGTSHFKNPYMAEPDYALAAMDFVARGLNHGARGFCFWTMHEMVYPPYVDRPGTHWNEIMTWALWDFEGKLKPVYHAAALMMRHMRPGMPVFPVESSAPGTVQAARVGERVFWVNLSPDPVEIDVSGFDGRQVGIVYADDPPGDFVEFNEESEATVTETGARFEAPGRSFGAIF